MSNPSGYGRTHGMPSLGRGSAPSLRSAHSGSAGDVEIFAPRSRASPESPVSGHELSDLVSRFQSLSTSGTDKLVRPGFGTRGAPITLRANLFQLNYPENVILYDYKIKVEPRIHGDDEDLRKYVVAQFERSKEVTSFLQGIAHDGARRLIARLPLPKNISAKIYVHVDGGKGAHSADTVYTVGLIGPKELRSADLARYLQGEDLEYNPAPILSAFNLIVTAHAARAGVRASGKHAYYFEPGSETSIRVRAGIAVVNGFFATVRPVFKSLMVNVNSCMSAFYMPRRLSDSMLEFLRQSHGSMHPQKFFGKVRVTTTYLGYTRRSSIKGFGSDNAREMIIRTEELGKVTVEKYFQKKYGITLQHADDLPVVNVGTKDKDVYVPAELCKIEPGNLFSGELTRRESAALCAANCRSPAGNAQTLTMKGLRLLGFEVNSPPMASFGIKVSLDMAVISARILPSPTVIYKSGRLPVVDGSWTTRGAHFVKPAQLTRLAVLVLQDGSAEDFSSNSEAELREVVKALLSKCHSCGMDVDPSYVVRVMDLPRPSADDPYRDQAVDAIRKMIQSFPGKPNIVLTLVSNRDTHIRAGMKRLFDTVLGCHGLSALLSNIRDKKGQDQYLTNLALKLNAKLGGVNHMLDPSSLKWLSDTMLVGLDVTHPGEGCIKGTPSIAAMAASRDTAFTHYPASVSLQEGKKQSITNVKNMMVERLKDYRRQMKAFPDRIVIFRGGVSDSFAQQVAKTEVSEIKKAFRDLADYKPRLTYIVCGRGHNTRFYPTRAEDADQTSNSKAGTVIDQGVTGIYDFDFYLQAHSATQGMVRATRYTVVYDENKFPPDILQQGINDVSYLWAPASKSVSLAPPAYWADRACAHARLYLHRLLPPVAGSKESKLSEKEIKPKVEALWGAGVHDDLKGTMYYM